MQQANSDCYFRRPATADDAPIPHPAPLNRRRFVALASGCLFCGAGAPRLLAAGEKPVDIGMLKDFAKDGIYDQFTQHNFFVIRHKGRLFTNIATCPHKGNYLVRSSRDATRIVCSGHDSVFTPEGLPLGGPVKRGLPRFAVSLNAEGHVLVNRGLEFPEKQWNDPRSYVPIK